MPARLTADTGVDALTHAAEAYVSRRANPVSDAFALSAIRTISANLRRVFRDGEDRDARAAMMSAATLAGMAVSNSSVALVHGMSRPIGADFDVAHALSNAMLFPAVTAFSGLGAPRRYAECARAYGVAEDGSDGPRDAATNISTTAVIETTTARPMSDKTRRTPRRAATTTSWKLESHCTSLQSPVPGRY